VKGWEPLLEAVRLHAERVLATRGRTGTGTGPLFPDALDRDTGVAALWPAGDGRVRIPSNLANQQNGYRTLHGLTALSGIETYATAAREALVYFTSRYQESGGLFLWGSHRTVDLLSGDSFGLDDFHELKLHLPWYEGLWAASPGATRAFIEAFWEAHVLDWNNLDMNRHGSFGRAPPLSAPWGRSLSLTPVFFVGRGLSFRNTGADLIQAAGELARLSGEGAPLLWAEALAQRYVATRHPVTGLGGYQYSEIEGDRARAQFGPELGDDVREHSILDRSRAMRVFGNGVIAQLGLAESLHSRGRRLCAWALEDLRAFVDTALDADGSRVYALLRDGRILDPSVVRRPGYYRPETFAPYEPPALLFWACARAWRLSHDPRFDSALRTLLAAAGCSGRWHSPGFVASPALAEAPHVLALAELYRDLPHADLGRALLQACAALRAHHEAESLFLASPRQRYGRIGGLEPLALLHAVAALRGDSPPLPPAVPSEPFFTAPGFGKARTSDYIEWFPLLRASPDADGEAPP
jgi:pectate lyase